MKQCNKNAFYFYLYACENNVKQILWNVVILV